MSQGMGCALTLETGFSTMYEHKLIQLWEALFGPRARKGMEGGHCLQGYSPGSFSSITRSKAVYPFLARRATSAP